MNKNDFIFKYRVRNWPEYNRALIRRGSLTFWIDEQAISGWRHEASVEVRGRFCQLDTTEAKLIG